MLVKLKPVLQHAVGENGHGQVSGIVDEAESVPQGGRQLHCVAQLKSVLHFTILF
jgi:hypothetical protein